VPSIRFWLILSAAIFAAAALIHFQVLMEGYDDPSAGIAESVIGGVLLLGFVLTLFLAQWTRLIAIIVQVFALLGTFVGLTLLLTVGPSSGLDLTIHLVMVAALAIGLTVAFRSRSPAENAATD
jgi:hypothetical protein